MTSDEHELRRMLCIQRHGYAAYTDDGEANFGGSDTCPPINYMTASIAGIKHAWDQSSILQYNAHRVKHFEFISEAALALYEGPFSFDGIYIIDKNGQMVADQGGNGEVRQSIALRIRGWGRVQYLPDPINLQNEIGRMIAEAMTEYWNKYKSSN